MAKKSNNASVQAIRLYLLKKSVQQYTDALRDDIEFETYPLDRQLGLTGEAFLRKSKPRKLSWAKFLQAGIAGRLPAITSTAHAAVVILEIDKRMVAVVFGMGRYMLKDTAYEADFGIMAVLNAVDPSGLRSADTFQYEAVAVHKRTQTSRTTSLAEFEIDTTREHFRSITGKAKEKQFADRVTGTEGGFGANVRVAFKDLAELCRSVLKAYRSKVYQQAFPRFDNLQRVADKQKLTDLESKLIDKLQRKDTTGVTLSPPEPVEYDDFSGFSFSPQGVVLDELTTEAYLESRQDLDKLDVPALKRHRVFLRKETIDEPLARWSVFKALFCEFPQGNNIYVLMNGEWYRVARTFANQVREFVVKVPEVDIGLPALGSAKTEPEYLAGVENAGGGLIVLDRKLAYCEDAGTQIEICDVLTAKRDFVHVKRKGQAASLSHMFFQGQNSAMALLRDPEFREKARQYLAEHSKAAVSRVPKEKPAAGSFRVVYAVMGKFTGKIADSLPFFSQLSLMSVGQELAERGVEVCLCPIS